MNLPLIAITRKQALLFASFLVLYEFLTYIANDMMMPGMVEVVRSFHAKESAIATSLTAYVLGGASLQLILGPFSDQYGRRGPMIAGSILFLFCTLLIANSSSMHEFLVDRFLQGMGLCFISVIGYATLQEIFGEMDAVRLIAIMTNISILAPLIGPLVGAFILYYFHWRMIFIIISIFSLVAVWGLYRFMPESVGKVKRDGEEIMRISFSFAHIYQNYKALATNSVFILGCLSVSLVNIPCLAWIALSPVILIKEAKLTVIQYSLWQIPLFGATILGNWMLHRLTYQFSLKKLTIIGSIIVVVSLLFMLILTFIGNSKFVWLMPGLLGYFFGMGICNGPLTRLTLFATFVAKGTASALLSMITMCAQAIGIEIANYLYNTHNNLAFAGYCAAVGILYALSVFVGTSLYTPPKKI